MNDQDYNCLFLKDWIYKKYADWLAEALDGDVLPIQDAKQKNTSYFDSYDVIIYGGREVAGKIHQIEWFKEKYSL